MKISRFNDYVNEMINFGLIGKEGRNLFSDRPDSIDAFRTALGKFKNISNIQPICKDEAYRENFVFDAKLDGKEVQFKIVNKYTKLILECPEIELRETVLTRLDQLDEFFHQDKI